MNRFEHYLPDLAHLAGQDLLVLDIGTGRGDFLRVLTKAGINCRGIDLNPEAVAAAQRSGVDVVLSDASDYLESLADESVGAVTAFHVVEHVPPAELIQLIDQIVRVLAPGGVLILRDSDPTNLVVGASSFYHDPTHQRPVTPDYLAFLVQDRGLINVQTRFLHPLPGYDVVAPIEEVLGGRSLQLLLDDVRWALKGPTGLRRNRAAAVGKVERHLRLAIVKPDWHIRGGFELVIDRLVAYLEKGRHEVTVLTVDAYGGDRRPFGRRVSDTTWQQAPQYFAYLSQIDSCADST